MKRDDFDKMVEEMTKTKLEMEKRDVLEAMTAGNWPRVCQIYEASFCAAMTVALTAGTLKNGMTAEKFVDLILESMSERIKKGLEVVPGLAEKVMQDVEDVPLPENPASWN